MKKLTITFVAILVCLSQVTFAQVEVGSAKAAAAQASANFDALNAKIKALKEKAAAEFSAEQSAIDAQKKSLSAKRADLEKDNASEKDMMADKWPARVSSREQLVKDESANRLRQQKLNLRKKSFETKIAQMEQKAKNSYVATVQAFLDSNNSAMQAFGAELDAMSY